MDLVPHINVVGNVVLGPVLQKNKSLVLVLVLKIRNPNQVQF
jgi:hypothetical protein